jgi:outer membrane immunogenic protein
MTRALLAATATLFLFAGSAYAADMPLKAPPAAAPAPTWTGWYIGINGGGG